MVDFLKEQADTAEVEGLWWKRRLETEDGIRSGDGLMVTLNCWKLTLDNQSPEKLQEEWHNWARF